MEAEIVAASGYKHWRLKLILALTVLSGVLSGERQTGPLFRTHSRHRSCHRHRLRWDKMWLFLVRPRHRQRLSGDKMWLFRFRPTGGISAQTPCGDEALQDAQNNSLSNGGPPRLVHPYLGVRQGDMAQGLDPGRISILWAGVDPRENAARSY